MKIQRLVGGSTFRSAKVILETDVERALLHSELLLIVDNAKGIRFNQKTGSYELTGEDLGGARHFGGRVENDPLDADARKVTVYID